MLFCQVLYHADTKDSTTENRRREWLLVRPNHVIFRSLELMGRKSLKNCGHVGCEALEVKWSLEFPWEFGSPRCQ